MASVPLSDSESVYSDYSSSVSNYSADENELMAALSKRKQGKLQSGQVVRRSNRLAQKRKADVIVTRSIPSLDHMEEESDCEGLAARHISKKSKRDSQDSSLEKLSDEESLLASRLRSRFQGRKSEKECLRNLERRFLAPPYEGYNEVDEIEEEERELDPDYSVGEEINYAGIGRGRAAIGKIVIHTDLTKEKEGFKILGRDKEVAELTALLAHPNKRGFSLLEGAEQVGKETIVRKFARRVKEGRVPPSLRGSQVIKIDCRALVGSHLYCTATSIPSLLDDLVRMKLRKLSQPILYFRDIDLILSVPSVAEYLDTILYERYPTIASLSGRDGLADIPVSARRLLGKFRKIVVREATQKETFALITQRVQEEQSLSRVQVNPKAISKAIYLSAKYDVSRVFPMKALDLIHEAVQRKAFQHLGSSSSSSSHSKSSLEVEDVAKVVSERYNVPMDQLTSSVDARIKVMRQRFDETIIGQKYAKDVLFSAINNYLAGISSSRRPWGVFLFVGPTGVGKTELVKRVAQELFDSDRKYIRFSMGEFIQDHEYSKLLGSPPGYVGNAEGGQLTNFLLENPESVVLFDEIEKAHPTITRALFTLFDEGRMNDGMGREIVCPNTLFVMTSNLGSEQILKMNDEERRRIDQVFEVVKPAVLEHFDPAFFNRVKVVPFRALENSEIPAVVVALLKRMQREMLEGRQKLQVSWSSEVVSFIASREYDAESGVRPIDKFVDDFVRGPIASLINRGGVHQGTKIALSMRGEELVAAVVGESTKLL